MRDREERESLVNSKLLNRYDFARASKAIDRYAKMGYGLDGMPLQRGQSPVTGSDREPKPEGGSDVTLEEQRARAISERASIQMAGAQTPINAKVVNQANQFKDLYEINRKLGAALRAKAEECEKLRIMLRTALETAWGPYFEEELRRIANGRERDAEKTAGPCDDGGDR